MNQGTVPLMDPHLPPQSLSPTGKVGVRSVEYPRSIILKRAEIQQESPPSAEARATNPSAVITAVLIVHQGLAKWANSPPHAARDPIASRAT